MPGVWRWTSALNEPWRTGVGDWQDQKFVAARAVVREKVGLGLYRMGLAADQTHQATAMGAKNRRQALGIAYFDVFHDAKVS